MQIPSLTLCAGNYSPLHRRTFKSPFPLSTAPTLASRLGLQGSTLTPDASPGGSPGLDRTLGIVTWALGTIPADATRTIEFDVLIKQDIPTFAYVGGVNTTLEARNVGYNFVATPVRRAHLRVQADSWHDSRHTSERALGLFSVQPWSREAVLAQRPSADSL